MKRIPEEVIQEVISKNDIVEVIGERIEVKKHGKDYISLCPFHNDTNPSMQISQQKQIYKCFSCGASGNAVGFLMDYPQTHFTYLQAIDYLAKKVGMDLNIDFTNVEDKKPSLYDEYYQINQEANNLFTYLIQASDDKDLEHFLNNRTLTKEIIDYFKIGYNPSGNVLTKLLQSKSYDLDKALDLDLLRLYDNNYVDAYSNRLTFPIIDSNDHIIGYTARAIKDENPKYLNSKESNIFHKSDVLYNINNALASIRKEKAVYICEGPNDVIAYYRVGIYNVVAIMGTALTNNHVSSLRNLGINKVILSFDGDSAGANATYKVINENLLNDLKLMVVDLETYDPDDYLLTYGSEHFLKNVTNPSNALDFIIKYEYANINLNNYEEKKQATLKIIKRINQSSDRFDIDYYLNKLSQISDMSLELLNGFVDDKVDTNININVKEDDLAYQKACKIALFFMMNDRQCFETFKEQGQPFIDKTYRKLYNSIAAFYLDHQLFDLNGLKELIHDQEIVDALTDILLHVKLEEYGDESVFEDSIKTVSLKSLINRKDILDQQFKISHDPLEKAKLAQEKVLIDRELKELKKAIFN